MNSKNVMEALRSAITPTEIRASSRLLSEYLATNPADADAVRTFAQQTTAALLERIEEEQQETIRFIALNGTRYNLEDWLTPAEYTKHYGLSTPNVITNWIARGVIPPADVLEVKELNNIRLIRNRDYKAVTRP